MGLTKELFIQIQEAEYGTTIEWTRQQAPKPKPSIDLEKAILQLLSERWQSEFEVIDGYNQHPEGLNFKQWLDKRGIENSIE